LLAQRRRATLERMSLPVIANVIRTTISRLDGQGRSAHNVMHFHSDSYSVSGLDTALQANVDRAMWDPVWEGYGAITLNYLPLDGTSATTTVIPTTMTDWTGEGTGELIPASAALIKLKTGLRGREHRGRIYLGGIAESVQSAGAIASATVTELQSKWSTFVEDMFTSSCPLLVASYKLATASEVQFITAETMAGTQRRRQTQLR
jgi:hypothetical protein